MQNTIILSVHDGLTNVSHFLAGFFLFFSLAFWAICAPPNVHNVDVCHDGSLKAILPVVSSTLSVKVTEITTTQ